MTSRELREPTPAAKQRFLRYAVGVLLASIAVAGLWFLLEARATSEELARLVAELEEEGLQLAVEAAPQSSDGRGGGPLAWLAGFEAATSPTWGPSQLNVQDLDAMLEAASAEATSLGLDASLLEDEGYPAEELKAWLLVAVERGAALPAPSTQPARTEELLGLLKRLDAGGLAYARQVVSQPRLTRADLGSSGEGPLASLPEIPVFQLRPVVERLARAARLEAAAGDGAACVMDLEAGFAAAALTVELDWWLGAVLWMSSEELMLSTLREVLPALEGRDLSALEARLEQHDPLVVARAALLGESAAVHGFFVSLEFGLQRWVTERDHIAYLRTLQSQLRELEQAPGPREPTALPAPGSIGLGITELVSVNWESILRTTLKLASERELALAALRSRRLGSAAALTWLGERLDPLTSEPYRVDRRQDGRVFVQSAEPDTDAWELADAAQEVPGER